MTTTTSTPFVGAQLQFLSNNMRCVANGSSKRLSPLFTAAELAMAQQKIAAWPGYVPTPLREFSALAVEFGVASILYKDEGERFGLGSFKALGGAYAVAEFARSGDDATVTKTVATATDGNHGLSVAWGAKSHGLQAVIFIHAKVSQGREQALLDLGAKVVRVDGNYDESVRVCYATAKQNGWHVVSDTTSNNDGYEVARTVMTGYSVMVAEIVRQFSEKRPTHVFVQGGVGGLAATVCEYFRVTLADKAPRFIVVEPELAPCLYLSAKARKPTAVDVVEETVMAGLSCGEVSSVAWPTLSAYADHFLTIPDTLVAPTMTLLANPRGDDDPVVAGESAVAGLAGFLAVAQREDLKQALDIGQDSRILVIGTEGATDPALYKALTGQSAASVRDAASNR